ncbi:MAG: c-type cytochrome [Candidatus Neomarinimicrobiota bacterium]
MNQKNDSLKEVDNLLPGWWKWVFIFTIVFSQGYLLYNHFFKSGELQEVEYYKELNPEWKESDHKMAGPSFRYKSPYIGSRTEESLASSETTVLAVEEPAVSEPILLIVLTDSESIEQGKSVYATNCVACHGVNGEGIIGPNFCDSNWIHGGAIEDLVRIINVGVPSKGMIPWDKTLTAEQILQVASYILTFEGTNPPNQKTAEGEIYKRG